ncbi:MAG: serine/threonine-protein kinase [Bryobacteraceae bacterium]|jgi:tetratricopeptide (TPR) repeat protein/predicted Ser/Thr protein kinase
MVGRIISHYEIIEKLGEGGMGVVYKAQDTHLDRSVAIKVLPPEMVADPERKRRFIQEARAASALRHPNIVTIYDIDQHDGADYIAMEYIPGRTLDQLIGRKGLRLGEALKYGVQIADALSRAHAAGIVHRDLKPGNIMVDEHGLVKVLDFGLAKLTEPTPGLDESTRTIKPTTEEGTIVGTVAYMSPEQAEGKPLDARSDIFSFGAMLYEMLSGRRAFQKDSKISTLAAVLTQEPGPLPDEIPRDLEQVVIRCLRKDPARRYQHMDDVKVALQELKEDSESGKLSAPSQRAAPAPRTHHWLWPAIGAAALVLLAAAGFFLWQRARAAPLTAQDTILLAEFVNTTGDPVFDLTLRQGLAAQLEQSPFLNLLAEERVREALRLMSRPPDTRITNEIGREICLRQNAKALIEGSIAALGAHYVLTVAAVQAATGSDIARLQVEAASKERVLRTLGDAAAQLRHRLGEALPSIREYDVPLDQATTSSLEALKAFSLGRARNSAGDYAEALRYQQRAIELDPNFATAYRGLATSYYNLGQAELAKEAARKAYELRERSSERERLMIESLYCEHVTGDIVRDIEILSEVSRTWPRYYTVWNQLGLAYRATGQDEKALGAFQTSMRLYPSALGYGNLAASFASLNRFAEAKEVCTQAVQKGVNSTVCHQILYSLAAIAGDDAAMKQQLDWAAARPDQYEFLTWQADTAAFQGQLRRERELRLRSVEYHLRRNARERAAGAAAKLAVDEAFFGQCRQAQQDAQKAYEIRPAYAVSTVAYVATQCGDTVRADSFFAEWAKTASPENTRLNEALMPCFRALVDARAHRPVDLSLVRGPNPYGAVTGITLDGCRGDVYLSQHMPAEAAAQFQHILDHRGWYPLHINYIDAHLGLARAAAQAGDLPKARKFYQDFFALMKDADQNLPLLLEAHREYEGLRAAP